MQLTIICFIRVTVRPWLPYNLPLVDDVKRTISKYEGLQTKQQLWWTLDQFESKWHTIKNGNWKINY